MTRKLKLWLIPLFILLIILFGIVCVMISISYTNQQLQTQTSAYKIEHSHIHSELDSLKRIIRERRDTIIIQTIPQEIKIYYHKQLCGSDL